MQKSENRLLTMIHDFFLIYLPSQRKSSPHTAKAYQTAVEQLMDYAAGQQECRITAVTFDMLDKNPISGFLDDLEQQGCSVSTRNHKLKSIRALFAYAAMMDISLARFTRNWRRFRGRRKRNLPVLNF